MTIKNRVENLEKKYGLSEEETIVLIAKFVMNWNTGTPWGSNETLSPKELRSWQAEVRQKVEGEIAKQRAEGNKFITVQTPYGYKSKD